MKRNNKHRSWCADSLDGYMEYVALYLTGKRKKPQYKCICCPNCGSRVIDEGWNTESEVHELRHPKFWIADYYIKCWKCKALLGLTKLNQAS